jgi:hypothetical protein
MLPLRNELPDDPTDWTNVDVSFVRLETDTAGSCPESFEQIMRYVQAESGDTDRAQADRLAFLRTALVQDTKYWLWNYVEEDGTVCFVVFRVRKDGSTYLGLSETKGLSPEQYLLADYYDEVYWP